MKSIITLLTETNAKLLSLGILLLRCALGLILLGVATGKVFGWFGGPGLEATIQNYATTGIPAPLAYLSTFTELIGGSLIVVGFLTRPAAFAVMINMLVATIVTLPMGFLTVAALPFSLLISAIVIQLAGPLGYSIDSLLLRHGQVIHERRVRDEAIRIEGTIDNERQEALRRGEGQIRFPVVREDQDQITRDGDSRR